MHILSLENKTTKIAVFKLWTRHIQRNKPDKEHAILEVLTFKLVHPLNVACWLYVDIDNNLK